MKMAFTWILAAVASLALCEGFTPLIPSTTRLNIQLQAEAQELTSDASTSTSTTTNTSRRTAVLICPAQFCVPADYDTFLSALKEKLPNLSPSSRVAELPRTEWIKVARQLPTAEFFSANLNNAKTLQWYFDAMEQGLADIYAEEGEDVNVCIIGHSIGGWVARSYLGGLGQRSTAVYKSTIDRCTSLVTLGSPHKAPSTALVDQTRGLLRAVEESEECSSEGLAAKGISVTCVGSTAVKGNIFTTNVEEIVATTSYIPLVDDWKDILSSTGINGDGIIPRDLAFMEAPSKRIEVSTCSITGNNVRHAHVLPTPYNLWDPAAPSIPLPEDFCWYGSPGVLDQWIENI
uniref:GPI inositol-deacylase n=1 Tax=Chaetoceros debilis TaxID=122233 RepID=A0A7S3Q8P4_9STRA